MRRVFMVVGATTLLVALLTLSLRALGADSVWFALLVVWLPMTWLGTMSRLVTPRLPDRFHRLHAFELDGRLYEMFGVRFFKRMLRRGPLAVFNPDLHLPVKRTPAKLAHLAQRMKDAEASHAILLFLTLGLATYLAIAGLWSTAGWVVVFDVLMNGYPVMLQRYNRVLLRRRFDMTAN